MDNSTIFTHFYFIKYVFVLVFKKIPLYRGFPLNLLTLNRGPTVQYTRADVQSRPRDDLECATLMQHCWKPRHCKERYAPMGMRICAAASRSPLKKINEKTPKRAIFIFSAKF